MYEDEEVLGTSQDNQETENTNSQTPVVENNQYQNHQGGKKNKKKNKPQYQQAQQVQQQTVQKPEVQEETVEESDSEEADTSIAEETAEIRRAVSVLSEPATEPEVTDTVQEPEAPATAPTVTREQVDVYDDEYVVVVGPQFRTNEEADKFFEKAYTRIDEPRLVLFTDKEGKSRFMVYGGWKTEREAVPCKKLYLSKGFKATIVLKRDIVD